MKQWAPKESSRRESRSWSVSDFVFQQRFSTVSDIGLLVAAVAARLNAESATLVVSSRTQVYRSLLLSFRREHFRYQRARKFESHLIRSATDAAVPLLLNALNQFSDNPQMVGIDWFQAVVGLPNDVFRIPASPFSKTDSAYVLRVNAYPPSGDLYVLLLLSGRISARPKRGLSDSCSRLSLAVYAHPAVRVSQHVSFVKMLTTTVTRYTDGVVSNAVSAMRDKPISTAVRAYVRAFLRALLHLTAATVGRWYVPSRSSKELTLLTDIGFARTASHQSALQIPQLVQRTYSERVPYIVNDFKAFFESHPEYEYDVPATRNKRKVCSALTIPIAAYDHNDAPVIAVAEILSSQPFLLHHLNIAEHTAAAYRRLLYEFQVELIKLLSSHSQREPMIRLGAIQAKAKRQRPASQIDIRFQLLDAPKSEKDYIPLEVKDSLSFIEFILTTIAAFTPSCYVGFRALSTDRQRLVRVLALRPRTHSIPSQDSILTGDYCASLTAYVARIGGLALVGDYQDPKWIEAFPGLQRGIKLLDSSSSLSVPVFAGTRLAGILHAESFLKHAFDGSRSTSQSCAALLGAELHGAYLRRVSNTFSKRGLRANALHKMINATDELEEELHCHRPLFQSRWSIIEQKLTDIRDAQNILQERRGASPDCIADMIRLLVPRFGLEYNIDWNAADFARLYVHRASAVDIRIIIEELLSNAAAAAVGAGGKISLRLGALRAGGVDFKSLLFMNTYASLPKGFEYRLFQESLAITGKKVRGGLGGIAAAGLAQSIGAQLYLKSLNAETRTIVVALDIPVLLLRGNNEA